MLLAGLLSTAPARGQSVAVEARAADLGLGPVLVWPVRLDAGRRFGYLAYVAFLDAYAVTVWHPSRSGPLGLVPVGGLCVEQVFSLPAGAWWQPSGPQPVDADGDHDDDLVLLEMDAPQRFRVVNLDLAACR